MITIKVNTQPILIELAQKPEQINKAIAISVSKLAKIGRDAAIAEINKVFDRPTPFTQKAVLNTTALKEATPISALVFIRDEASKGNPPSKYLAAEISGGARRHTRFEGALAAAGRLPNGMYVVLSPKAPHDQYGNLEGGAGRIQQILSQVYAQRDQYANQTARSKKRSGGKRREFFIGEPGGKGGTMPLGIYQRLAQGVRPMFIFVNRAPSYKVRFPFESIVRLAVEANTQQVMNEVAAVLNARH